MIRCMIPAHTHKFSSRSAGDSLNCPAVAVTENSQLANVLGTEYIRLPDFQQEENSPDSGHK